MFKWFNKRRQNLDESMYNIENIHPKIKEIADNFTVEKRSYERVNQFNFFVRYKVDNFIVTWNDAVSYWPSINLDKKCEDGECKEIFINKDEKYCLWEAILRESRESERRKQEERELQRELLLK